MTRTGYKGLAAGHIAGENTAHKVLLSGLQWPAIIRHAQGFRDVTFGKG